MTRDKALMNSLTVFTYLTTHYPNEVINLSQYYHQMLLTLPCSEMTDQDIEDLSKHIDFLRIEGSKMSIRSFASRVEDDRTITLLQLTWDHD